MHMIYYDTQIGKFCIICLQYRKVFLIYVASAMEYMYDKGSPQGDPLSSYVETWVT